MQPFTQHNESWRRGTSSLQLAALSRSDFDIPPRTRRLIAVAGAAGIVVSAAGSLVGGQDQTIELDKILHFSGYAILAALFVLALRPLLFGLSWGFRNSPPSKRSLPRRCTGWSWWN
jgi:hypothetical protein